VVLVSRTLPDAREPMIEVRLLANMGSDLSIVQDARISFGNHETEWNKAAPSLIEYLATGLRSRDRKALRDRLKDADTDTEADALIDEIQAIQKHWSPFAHAVAKFYIKAPLNVARQLWKSHIGLASQDEVIAWNEVSRRYVNSEVDLYMPEWSAKPVDAKQGAGDPVMPHEKEFLDKAVSQHHRDSADLYKLVSVYAAPEQARMVVPQSMMTEWVWTGSLAAFARVVTQRMDATAQNECKPVAQRFSEELSVLYPVAWKALVRPRRDSYVGRFW